MMKRLWLAVGLVLVAPACSRPLGEADEALAGQASAWQRPPAVETVARTAASVVIAGQAYPGARVVLRGVDGEAFAAAADSQGRFELRLAPAGDLVLTPEVQNGQDTATSPDRLVLLAAGPALLLRVGQASQRMDGPSGPLDAIDADGAARIASGRAAPGASVLVDDGRERQTVVTDRHGRWTALVGPGSSLVVNERTYALPEMAGLGAARAGHGWRIGWEPPGGGRQTTWAPDGA